MMNVDLVLVSLIGTGQELRLVVTVDGQLPRTRLQSGDDIDSLARQLAEDTLGSDAHVEQHQFAGVQGETGADLLLIYRQLLPRDCIRAILDPSRQLPVSSGVPLGDGVNLYAHDVQVAEAVIDAIRNDLRQVMHARENKRGLLHLLHLLPAVFDHKELMAAYVALMDEKPASSFMLARMMLDKYTMGSGEKERQVQGRNLIREYTEVPDEMLADKWEKNRDLYRKGGPKTKRLYKQVKCDEPEFLASRDRF